MYRPKILWIDLRIRRDDKLSLPAAFERRCELKVAGGLGPGDAVPHFKPDALCFDFDYPDLNSLRLLQDTKRMRPSLPLIMLTEQHSEKLAVWAFRTRVWDYLAKPVAENEANWAIDGLLELSGFARETRRRAQNPLPPMPSEARFPGTDSVAPSVNCAVRYIRKHLGDKIREKEVAKHCGLSPFRFSRAFKQEMGITFQEYLIRERITESCRLMYNPQATITDIAYTVGFNDPSYFARMFKRYMGRSPSEYRQLGMPGQPNDSGLWARLELPVGPAN